MSAKRARSRVVVRARSFLDAGTEVLPGERKFLDYALPPTHVALEVVTNTGGRVHGRNSFGKQTPRRSRRYPSRVQSFDPATMWNAPRVRPGGHDQTKPFFLLARNNKQETGGHLETNGATDIAS